ncbi:MAG: SRPBCC domain-containing protein [Phycisphaeraceae bacterium]|nr:SRPBCC domain-containing protein [Phycisphaeraceae bacterium]
MASDLRGVRTSGREMIVTRVIDAPRELVFEAWSRPEHLARWWGPRGFTTTTREMEFKAGGVWRLCMHGPDGRDYENQINYVEIVRPERIVYRHGGDIDHGPVHFDVTVTFEEAPGGKTRLTMRSVMPSAEVLAHVVKEYGALEGAMQTIDRLTEELASTAVKTEPGMFAISRVIDAPRERVFEVWTKQEHLAKWFGPKGFEITESRLELRVGGVYHYCMRSEASSGGGGTSGGWEMWGKWVFREISRPERLVFVSGFSDPAGKTARSPFPGPWPLETLSVVTFAEQEDWTVVTVAWRPLEATAEERAEFEKGMESMRKGWTGTFERLEGYVGGR